MPNSPNNPAGRLLATLERVHQQKDATIEKGWTTILGAQNRADLLNRLSAVVALPGKVELAVKQIEDMNHDVYLSWVPQVKEAFSFNQFNERMGTIAQRADVAVMSLVRICDEQLSPNLAENVMPEEEHTKLSKVVRQLITETRDSDLAAHLKDYVLRHLMMIERALLDYRLQGIRVLEHAAEAAVGAVLMRPERSGGVDSTGIGRRFKEYLKTYILAVTAASQTLSLPEKIKKMLPQAEDASPCAEAEPHAPRKYKAMAGPASEGESADSQ